MTEPKKCDPWHRNKLIREGILRAIYERMKVDPSVYILGEGAIMKTHYDAPQIEKEFPDRIITLPISEDGNSNFGVGMALGGALPIIDVITADFLYRTMDAICNTMRVTNFVQEPKTIIIRAEFLTAGPTTGARPEALFTHIPGLNVVIPSNPIDAYVLMKKALQRKEITLFFEDRMIEDSDINSYELVPADTSLMEMGLGETWGKADATISPFNTPQLTIVSYGLTLRMLKTLMKKRNLPFELIDLRSIYPLDFETIFASVRRTHNLLIVEPDVQYAGVGAEISAQVGEASFPVNVKRLGAPRATIPAARNLQEQMIPTEQDVLKAIDEMAGL